MKKLLFTLSLATLLSGCSSPLDKKVNVANYAQTMEQIKTKTNEYSPEDYDIAGDNLAGLMFGAALAGEKGAINLTYRDILDQAKAQRKEKEEKEKAYHDELDKLRNYISVKVLDGRYERDEDYYDYPDRYHYRAEFTTKGEQSITAFKGWLKFYNENDDLLFQTHFDEAFEMKMNETNDVELEAILDSDDNITEAKALPFNKIKTVWEPSLVIFKDGTRLTANK